MTLHIENRSLSRALFALAVAATAFLIGSGIAFAQTDDADDADEAATTVAVAPVTYPIDDLGGCADRQACFRFCAEDANKGACLAWAETHGKITNERALKVRNVRAALAQGRMECGTSIAECRVYCETHDCSALAERHALWTQSERDGHERLMRAKAALAAGKLACGTTVAECRAYCEANDCADIARQHGIWNERQLQRREEMRSRMEELGCDTVEACRALCAEDPSTCASMKPMMRPGAATPEQREAAKERMEQRIEDGVPPVRPRPMLRGERPAGTEDDAAQ
jgi:hypothetical protein